MAQYGTDFSEYATNSEPGDWTRRFNTDNTDYRVLEDATAEGGKYLRIGATANARRGLSWDAVDSDAGRDDCEVLFRTRSSPEEENTHAHAFVRGAGGADNETAYQGGLRRGAEVTDRIVRSVEGTHTALSSGPLGWDVGVWYWMRFRVEGTALKLKRWEGGVGDEPAEWVHELTDSQISDPGWIGVWGFRADLDYDVVAIGTDGDTAIWPLEQEQEGFVLYKKVGGVLVPIALQKKVGESLVDVSISKVTGE